MTKPLEPRLPQSDIREIEQISQRSQTKMMTPLTNPRALDAAARAIAINWGYDPDLHWRGYISDDNVSEAAEAALSAVLPKKPPEWFEEWMLSYGYSDGPIFRVEAWCALRKRALGGAA